MGSKAYRLPGNVRPTRYDVHLDAEVARPTFEGRVIIALDVLEATRVVELHARDLEFAEVRIDQGGGASPGKPTFDADREMVAIEFDRPLAAGAAVLHIGFTGKVSANMEGLYLSQDGDEACLATQCQETDARAVFPCFDEPAFKAIVQWTVTTSPDVTVLTNGSVHDVADAPEGRRTWAFEPTRPISTYLVAVAIGRFGGTPAQVVHGTPLRVWSMEGKQRFGGFAQDFAAHLLPWFESYFATPYPYGKYDQLAVPSFSAGAMENPGLVLFRQSLLLHDPRTTSWAQEKSIARVVAHEFAHMWFGNLVTMAWWDDIWLNEAFAEWIAYKVTNDLAPAHRVWDDFHESKRSAQIPDALESTHPIYAPVETAEQATEMFDAITYNKGASVMRMCENFLGEEAFRAGLRTYMAEFAEANAQGADLWRHLEAASSWPVGRLMESWVVQGGYPTIRASLSGDGLAVSQTRYHSSATARDSGASWMVPLVIRYADEAGVHEHRHLLESKEDVVSLEVAGAVRWCTVNADGVGFYRQELDAELQAKLVAHADELTPAEQMDLLDDAWALVLNGRRDIGSFLDVLASLTPHAGSHSVLAFAVDRLKAVGDLVAASSDQPTAAKFAAWAGQLLSTERERTGLRPVDGETRDSRERRVSLLRGLVRSAKDVDATRVVRELAGAEASDPAAVDATLAGPVVTLAAEVGDAARLENHLRIYADRRARHASPQEIQRYLYSLVAYRDPALLAQVIQKMKEGAFPLEAVGPMLRLMFSEPATSVAAWNHLRAEWATIRRTLGDMWTGSLVEHTGKLPVALKADVVTFFEANLGDVARQSYARAVEALDQRAGFENRTRSGLIGWFAKA